MVRIFFIPLLYAKVVYNQGEIFVPVLVCPESLCDIWWYTAIGFGVFLKHFVSYDTWLYQAIYDLFYSDIYVDVNLLVVQAILVNDILGKEVGFYFVISFFFIGLLS